VVGGAGDKPPALHILFRADCMEMYEFFKKLNCYVFYTRHAVKILCDLPGTFRFDFPGI
jgi:hypothetical protein